MSKLKAIELYNFMTVRDGRFEFDETNVINLVGYNDSGKSSVTRALEVILYDAYPNDQVNFITDDEEMFGVGLEFTDGVEVNKYKYSTGQSVWEMKKDGDILYTNRLASGIASIHGVPEPIRDYLGVVEDNITGQYLNVRRNSDKAFLVQTSGGDNYKILNSILRADVLANAVSELNKDRNRLQTEITSTSTMRDTLRGELNGIKVLPDKYVSDLQGLTVGIRSNQSKVELLTHISDRVQEYNSIHVTEEISTVDLTQYSLLESVVEAYNATQELVQDELSVLDVAKLDMLEIALEAKRGMDIVVPDELSVLDTSKYDLMTQIVTSFSDMNIFIQPELPTIDAVKLDMIRSVGETFNALYHETNKLNQIEQERDSVVKELQDLSNQYGFKICGGCGSVVEFEGDHVHG